MYSKNMLSESALKIAFGQRKDGSMVLVSRLDKKKSNATQRKIGKTVGRQVKG